MTFHDTTAEIEVSFRTHRRRKTEHGRTDRHDSWNSYLDVALISKYYLDKPEDKNDIFNSHPKVKGLTDETKLDVTNSPVPYIMR